MNSPCTPTHITRFLLLSRPLFSLLLYSSRPSFLPSLPSYLSSSVLLISVCVHVRLCLSPSVTKPLSVSFWTYPCFNFGRRVRDPGGVFSCIRRHIFSFVLSFFHLSLSLSLSLSSVTHVCMCTQKHRQGHGQKHTQNTQKQSYNCHCRLRAGSPKTVLQLARSSNICTVIFPSATVHLEQRVCTQ